MSRGETVTITEHEQEGTVRLSQVVIALEHGGSVWEPVRKATFLVVKNSKETEALTGENYWEYHILKGLSDRQL